MNLIILSDSFPQKKILLQYKSTNYVKNLLKHKVTLIFPSTEIEKNVESNFYEGIKVVILKLKSFQKKTMFSWIK